MTTLCDCREAVGDRSNYDILGQLLLVMKESDISASAMNKVGGHLDFWRARGQIHLEWIGGPTGDEARQYLMSLLVDSGNEDLRADDLALDPSVRTMPDDRVHLVVHGVKVQLRHLNPIGLFTVRERIFPRQETLALASVAADPDAEH